MLSSRLNDLLHPENVHISIKLKRSALHASPSKGRVTLTHILGVDGRNVSLEMLAAYKRTLASRHITGIPPLTVVCRLHLAATTLLCQPWYRNRHSIAGLTAFPNRLGGTLG